MLCYSVLTAMLCEDVASNPGLVRPQSLDPGALSLSQPPGQRRVGVGLVVAKLGMVKVRRAASTTSRLLALLSPHAIKICLEGNNTSWRSTGKTRRSRERHDLNSGFKFVFVLNVNGLLYYKQLVSCLPC